MPWRQARTRPPGLAPACGRACTGQQGYPARDHKAHTASEPRDRGPAELGVEYHSIDPDDKTVYGLLTGKSAATIAAIRRTGVTGISRGIDYIGLMLAARVTLPHFSVSLLARDSDVPALFAYVGYRWKTGNPLLGLSLTGFDP